MTTGETEEAELPAWRRLWDRLRAAARWALDVLRGHAGSRHLNRRK